MSGLGEAVLGTIAFLPLSSAMSYWVDRRAGNAVLMALMEACLQDHLVSEKLTSDISLCPSSFCFVRNKLCGI